MPPPEAAAWNHPHLLGLEHLTGDEIRHVLRVARQVAGPDGRHQNIMPHLHNKIVGNLFFEDSTRTRASFRLAARYLSAEVLDFSSAGSSTSKGETLVDTARNIEAMGVDMLVCRHQQSGAAELLARSCRCSIINAGDGQHEHPTQGLLDLYTICDRLGRHEDPHNHDLSGLTVAIVGDIAHSRVARSNIHGLLKLGAHVILIAPPNLLPGAFTEMGCELSHHLDDVLDRIDVINMLRVQFERMSSPAFPSAREYKTLYGLTRERLRRAKPDLLVMHPGPMNRGLEIESEVADGPQSAVLEQVTHGLSIRIAVMFLCYFAWEGQRPRRSETTRTTGV